MSAAREDRGPAPPGLSLEELESRLEEAEGDPKRVARLLNVLALSVIEEVREHAEARSADATASAPEE